MGNEADTCRTYIVPKLHAAGWDDDFITEQMVLTPGRIVPVGDQHTRKAGLRPDYVLFVRRNIPIAVVEAKADFKLPADGLQQAMQYAEMLGLKFAYSSNGTGIVEHDYTTGCERDLSEFPTSEELWGRLKGTLAFATEKDAADALTHYFEQAGGKLPRYYQQVAINLAVNAVLKGQQRILLTMATGTGKTLVAFQIVWRLWKAGRKKRILYLADRNVLIDQAKDRTFSPMDQALHKIRGKATKSREVYFALYQALANPTGGPNLYEQYPKDFFDLIIVDECHRGSANELGSWREILEYFSPATQIGMTATPKIAGDNINTYEYFGDPIYTYSLRQGIEDGFLAPYRVYRVIPDVDASGLQIDPGVLDRFGREIPPGLYGTKDFERVLSLLTRTEVVARHLTEYLKRTNRFDKTIVFCVDQEHALDMRKALNNANADLTKEHPHYVERVVSDEGSVGRGHLDDFQDPEKELPVILTTSQMLTTGIDAPTCRNIVLFKPINSMIDFKQIIGRGTRVLEEHNKFWFTIIDYVGATQLFLDPGFDGDPVRVTKTEIDGKGHETKVQDSEAGTLEPETEDDTPEAVKQIQQQLRELPRKYYVDNVQVYIAGEQAFELDPDGNMLRTVQFTDYVSDSIRRLNLTAEHLKSAWPQAVQRSEILEQLRARGIDPDHLAHVTHQEEADALDLLLHVAYNAPLVTRRERAQKLRQQKANFFNTFTPAARGILNELLDKYADYGIGEFDQLPRVLQVWPFDGFGAPQEIYALFGGPQKLLQAVDEMQALLYAE